MPYTTLSDIIIATKNDTTFDFIIVGAGSAGCPLASRLSEDPSVTVLLIEAGQRQHGLEETINVAIPAAVGKLQHTNVDWQYYAEPQAPRACTHLNTFQGAVSSRAHRSYWPRGKGVGGSSLINYMAWVRGHPNDYNEWETRHGCKGWGWASLRPLFEERIENIAECDPSRLCPKCRHRTKSVGPYGIGMKNPVCPLATHFLRACQELGFESGDYNCGCKPRATKGVVGLHQQSVRSGTRCSAARAYIDPLLAAPHRRPNLTVLAGVRCTRLLTATDNGRVAVTGVELVPDDDPTANATPVNIRCGKEVILSAGALGSPQILLQSGVGPNGSVLHSPHVGQNMHDHLVAFLRFPPQHANQDIGTINGHKAEGWRTALYHMWDCFLNHRGMLTSSAYDASLFYSSKPVTGLAQLVQVRPNLQISCFCSGGDAHLWQGNVGLDVEAYELDPAELGPKAEGLVFCCTLLHPQSRGNVTVNERNELVIQANYLTDPEDLKQLIACLRKAIELANTTAYKPIVKGAPFWPADLCRKYNIPQRDSDNVPAPGDYPDEFLEECIRRYATTLYHPTSTCRMGTSATEAVVDPTLKVYGVDHLRIADASIQPAIVSANTQASCVLIGEKAADILREEYNLKSNPQDLLDAVQSYEVEVLRNRRRIAGGLIVTAAAAVVGLSMLAWRGGRRGK